MQKVSRKNKVIIRECRSNIGELEIDREDVNGEGML